MARDLGRSAIVGAVLVLPFAILEAINAQDFSWQRFPFPLFVVMWMLAAAFVLLITPVVRNVRAGGINLFGIGRQIPRVLLVALIAWLWAGLVADQMPCFLGVPNCD